MKEAATSVRRRFGAAPRPSKATDRTATIVYLDGNGQYLKGGQVEKGIAADQYWNILQREFHSIAQVENPKNVSAATASCFPVLSYLVEMPGLHS